MDRTGGHDLPPLALILHAGEIFQRVHHGHVHRLARIVVTATASGDHAREERFINPQLQREIIPPLCAAVTRVNIDHHDIGREPNMRYMPGRSSASARGKPARLTSSAARSVSPPP